MPTVKPIILDGDEVRPMTEAEYAQWLKDADERRTRKDAETAKQVAKQAVLDKLGLTADEASLLG